MNEPLTKFNREDNDSSNISVRSRSSTRSEKFMRSISIPLHTSTASTLSSPTLLSKNKSALSARSNSMPGPIICAEEEMSIGKRIKRRLSSKVSAQQPSPVSPLTRTRSNSLRTSSESQSNNSPLFNTYSFSDITEDYFKYDTKRRNKSSTSTAESYTSNGSYSQDPLDSSSQNFEEDESVYSSVSLNPDVTLEHINPKDNANLDVVALSDDDKDAKEEELAESMAFDILAKIKEISLIEENEEQKEVYSL